MEFNSIEEIEKYYDKASNTYKFIENGEYIDLVAFNFSLIVDANIDAFNIIARNIAALNIDVFDIKALEIDVQSLMAFDIKAYNIIAKNILANNILARNIDAKHISYYAVCYAYNNIRCKSIKGRISKAKHFVVKGEITIDGKTEENKW